MAQPVTSQSSIMAQPVSPQYSITAQGGSVVVTPQLSGCSVKGSIHQNITVNTSSHGAALTTGTTPSVFSQIPPINYQNPLGQAFLKTHRMALETRMGCLNSICRRLEDRGVLSDEEREEVVSKSTRTRQNQALLDMLVRKGGEAQEEFYQALREADGYLVRDLEKNT
ncbi:hypothetical protein UPYG_G00054000 [Umbra pygmaea]|uniref:CARD domain-containing protein n=1 Tax=Umbra pygmaea TaxID=75934 RepID=A0ABD0XBA1_UMBPY